MTYYTLDEAAILAWCRQVETACGVTATASVPSAPTPPCPRCERLAAPEHVEPVAPPVLFKCRCWWCGNTWSHMELA